jgi:hypothetical protein
MRSGTVPFNCWLGGPDHVFHEIEKLLGLYAVTPKSNENAEDITTTQDENYEPQDSICAGR